MTLSSLPSDLLAAVASHLNAATDILALSSTCRALRDGVRSGAFSIQADSQRDCDKLERQLLALEKAGAQLQELDARETTLTQTSLGVVGRSPLLRSLIAADVRGPCDGGRLPGSLERLGGTVKLLLRAPPSDSLRVLAVPNARIENIFLQHIAEACGLRFLFLGGSRLSEAALARLPELFGCLNELRAVDLTCCELRTAREIRRALAAQPEVLVLDLEYSHSRKSFDELVAPHIGPDFTSLILTAANGHKHTLLHLAAERGDAECVRWCIRAGANLAAKDDSGCTPLFVAADTGHASIVDILAESCPASIESRNHNLETPLYIASLKGHLAVVRALLARGAAADGCDWNGWSCLQASCINRNHHAEVVKALLDAGADAAAANRYGTTALHIAARGGFTEAVRLLLAAGAPSDARDESGMVPAHLTKSADVAALLAARGASPAPAAPSGKRPWRRHGARRPAVA